LRIDEMVEHLEGDSTITRLCKGAAGVIFAFARSRAVEPGDGGRRKGEARRGKSRRMMNGRRMTMVSICMGESQPEIASLQAFVDISR